MGEEAKTLKGLLESFKEALCYWYNCLNKPETFLREIQASEVEKPCDELQKLAKLIKAHTTKVGIVFKLETLSKGENAAFSTLQNLSKTAAFMVSVTRQLRLASTLISQIYYDNTIELVRLVLGANLQLVEELIVIEQRAYEKDSGEKELKPETDERLISIGRVWASCDDLAKSIEEGPIGLLGNKIKISNAMIGDGLEEFEEWASNPDAFDDDEDPFGFGSESDDENEDEDAIPPTGELSAEKQEIDAEAKQKLMEYSQLWLGKFKLVKLLLSSLTKSLPSITSGAVIDSIFAIQRDVASEIDELVVKLMLDQVVDEECEEIAAKTTKNCHKLVKLVQDANKLNENRVKWLGAWSSKFNDGIKGK